MSYARNALIKVPVCMCYKNQPEKFVKETNKIEILPEKIAKIPSTVHITDEL